MIKLFKQKSVIEFYCHPDMADVLIPPKPAAKYIADWFKRIKPSYEERDTFGAPAMTAKKCMPMLDAMSLGYVIPLQGDLSVKTNEDCSQIDVHNPPLLRLAEFHDIRQIGGSAAPGAPAKPIKFINHWVVKTKPGWSTLFMPLINGGLESPHFTCLGGLVDTDTYPKEVNFPAIWHTKNADVTLEAGTPLVVAIPILRSSIPTSPSIKKMSKKEFDEIELIRKKQDSRRHVYTQELRESRK